MQPGDITFSFLWASVFVLLSQTSHFISLGRTTLLELFGQSPSGSLLSLLDAGKWEEWLEEVLLCLSEIGTKEGVVEASLNFAKPPGNHFLVKSNLGTAANLGERMLRDNRLGSLSPAVSNRLMSDVRPVRLASLSTAAGPSTSRATVREEENEGYGNCGTSGPSTPTLTPNPAIVPHELSYDQCKMLDERDPRYIDGQGRSE